MATITVVTTQTIDIPNLGNLIRREIRDRGLTWNQVAVAIKMGRTTLWRIITGKLSRISSRIADGFNRVLGIDLGVSQLDHPDSIQAQATAFEGGSVPSVSTPISAYDEDEDEDDYTGYVDIDDYYANLTPEQEAELLRMEEPDYYANLTPEEEAEIWQLKVAEGKQAENREILRAAREAAKTVAPKKAKKAKKVKKNFMHL